MTFGNYPKAADNTPLGEVYTPETANGDTTALEGGPVSTDSLLNKSAPASIYVKDGNDLTQGAKADAAYTSGSGSVISILKGIFTKLAGTLTVSGSVSTSGTVTEANSAAIKTDADSISTNTTNTSTVLGSTTDVAVVGDNAGTASAKLRGLSKILNDIWDSVNHRIKVDGSGVTQPVSGTVSVSNFPGTQPVSGTITANAGTNLNTSLLAIESGGHLASIDSHIPLLGQAVKASSVPVALASDQGDLPVKGDFTSFTGLSASALNADLFPGTDVSAYKWVTVHILTSAYSGTLTFQSSGDNSNYPPTVLYRQDTASAGNSGSTATGTNLIYAGPLSTQYFRIRMTAYTSGTAQAVVTLWTVAPSYALLTPQVIQSGTWTVQPGNTQNTTPWLVSAGPPADLTLIASAAFTTTQTTADQTNFAGKGIRVVLDVTTAGTGSVTLEIDAKDVASGKYIALLTGAAVTTVSTNVYVIHPELTAAANSIAKDVLPHTWRVKVTSNNANTITYSVGASYLS